MDGWRRYAEEKRKIGGRKDSDGRGEDVTNRKKKKWRQSGGVSWNRKGEKKTPAGERITATTKRHQLGKKKNSSLPL